MNDHLGTSGILMGVNAPPLYDACLVGRWDDVLDICGVVRGGNNSDGDGDVEMGDGTATSDDSPSGATVSTTHCSSSVSNDGDDTADTMNLNFPQEDEGAEDGTATDRGEHQGGDTFRPARLDTSNTDTDDNTETTRHPCLQTRYTDRRRNTPLHLACRRQPPPNVVRALLNQSPCEAVSRRTADGLTPLHFAAYCGAGVEVVSMLVDRMRSDAAVGKAMRLSSALIDENEAATTTAGAGAAGGVNAGSNRSGDSRWRAPSSDEDSLSLPPTRLLDRRRRTPLHCALSGFRTPIRPMVVRKLLAVDPASATLGDERGRTPLSLLFDDYAEEIMEALEDDILQSDCKGRIDEGGELYECWKMLNVLLQAAYQGSVSEDEEDNGGGGADGSSGEESNNDMAGRGDTMATSSDGSETPLHSNIGGGGGSSQGELLDALDEGRVGIDEPSSPVVQQTTKSPQPQDRTSMSHPQTREVDLGLYDQEHFSIVHAAAGVWECPAPLAKLVLKVMCSNDPLHHNPGGPTSSSMSMMSDYYSTTMEESGEDWDHTNPMDVAEAMSVASSTVGEKDYIRQPDEETMRLPLHIAVCARPQAREGYSARLKVWLSSPEASSTRTMGPRRPSQQSIFSTTESLATHPDRAGGVGNRGRSANAGQVYNPRFGRSPSRDSVVALTTSQGGAINPSFPFARSGSNSSISASIAREPFLQHTMVRDVLNLYPAAAAVVDDRTGKLPIVLAIEHGKSWETAVGPLLEAHPKPFGGGGDGGMALPDDSDEGRAHRLTLQSALFLALSSPESHVREEATRTAGKLANWGGVYGMPGSLDGIICEWLNTMENHNDLPTAAASSSPEGIVVGPGAASASEWIQTQASNLTAVAEVVSQSRPESISDRVARLCLDTSCEYLYSQDGSVREAAARVLGNTLNSVGDADDSANVMREVVLCMVNDEVSVCSSSSASKAMLSARNNKNDVVVRHGRLLACHAILQTQWGSRLMATRDIRDAILRFFHRCVRNKNTVVRCAAYQAAGSILGKSPPPEDPKMAATMTTSSLKEMRSDILKGTRASEQVDVQMALARGLTSASRMHPNLFLCKSGMPIMDAALMLAMSSSSARPNANVQKAFQIFLWVALQMGTRVNEEHDPVLFTGGGASNSVMSPGLDKYIALAEGENGGIMMKFVHQTLAKIEDTVFGSGVTG